MVNKTNVDELADYIALRRELPFDMNKGMVPQAACGTAGCIGGFAASLWSEVYELSAEYPIAFSEMQLAMKLGIGKESLDALCYPADMPEFFADTDEPISYSEITRSGAVATLRRLGISGRVEWLAAEQTRSADEFR